MKYAIINENIVTDIIIWDSDIYPSFDINLNVIKIPENINVLTGDEYDQNNNSFIHKTPERYE